MTVAPIDKPGIEYRFGPFRFIPGRQLLLYRGAPVRLGSRDVRLLHILVARAGEVVSKKELRAFVWPDAKLHDSNLKVHISTLRRAMLQPAEEASPIATVQGEGYLFTATVEVVETPKPDGGNAVASPAKLPPPCDIIGRGDALRELHSRLLKREIVTIVGPGGVGKTAVAVAAVHALVGHYRDGTCFVNLADVEDVTLVAGAVATALGIGSSSADMGAVLISALRARDILLVLDTCEHVRSAVAMLCDQLRTALPSVAIMATSREPLRARTEVILRLAPLDCPETSSDLSAEEALLFPAVEFFSRRAEALHHFRLSDADAPTVALLCRLLDGIPLAIELAVRRMENLSPAALMVQLESSFDLLEARPPVDPPRHRSWRATLDWSYRLLSPDEARLFRWMSIFAGEFTVSDIIGLFDGDGTRAEAVATLIDNLVAKSLVILAYKDGRVTFRLFAGTRRYAAEAREATEDAGDVSARHARHLLQTFETAEAQWLWRSRPEWTERYGALAQDLGNAIDWAFLDDHDPLLGVRLTVAALPLWDELSTVGESHLRVVRALESLCGLEGNHTELKMKLMASLGAALNFSDRLGCEADRTWKEAYRLAMAAGDADYELRALWGQAVLQSFSGRHRLALSTLGHFIQLAEAEGERAALPDGARLMLMTRFYRGETELAESELGRLEREQCGLSAHRCISRFQVDRLVGIRVGLAHILWARGDHGRAVLLTELALARAAELGHRVSQSNALAQAGIPLALHLQDLPLARERIQLLTHNLSLRETEIWNPVCRFFEFALAAAEGNPRAVDAMGEAISELVRNNFLIRLPMYLSIQAEAALRFGRVEVAGLAAAEALERAARQEEQWYAPEAIRMKALVAWRVGDLVAAESLLAEAVEWAKRIGVRTLELRAATSLAELLIEQRRRPEAAIRINSVFAHFDRQVASPDIDRAGAIVKSLTAA